MYPIRVAKLGTRYYPCKIDTQVNNRSTHHEVGILSSRHLVVEDTGIGCTNVGLETAVEHADLTPVQVQ